MKMRYCTNCGHKIPADSKFCPICGATLNPNIPNAIVSSQSKHTQSSNTEKIRPINTGYVKSHNPKRTNPFLIFIDWVDAIINVIAIYILYNNYEAYQNYRPINQNRIGHPIKNFFANAGNNIAQGISRDISPAIIAKDAIPYFVALTIISGILYFALHKKQSKLLNGFMLFMSIIMAIILIVLLVVASEN